MIKDKTKTIILIIISIMLCVCGCSVQNKTATQSTDSTSDKKGEKSFITVNPIFYKHIATNGAMISLIKKDGTMNAAFYTMVDLFSTDVDGWENIVSIKQHGRSIYGLSKDGTVYGTHMPGSSDEPYYTREAAKDVVAFTPSAMSTSSGSTLLCVHKDGTVKSYGEIYKGSAIDMNVGQNDVEDWKDIVEIEANGYHTLGLRKDGTVVATGRNDHSQCDVSDWTDIVFIACGGADQFYSVGVQANGKVVYAGDNETLRQRFAELSDIKSVSLHDNEDFIALKKDGTVVMGDKYGRDEMKNAVSSWTDIVEVYYGAWPDKSVGSGDELVIGLKQNGEILWHTPIENARTDIAAYFDKIGMLKTEE